MLDAQLLHAYARRAAEALEALGGLREGQPSGQRGPGAPPALEAGPLGTGEALRGAAAPTGPGAAAEADAAASDAAAVAADAGAVAAGVGATAMQAAAAAAAVVSSGGDARAGAAESYSAEVSAMEGFAAAGSAAASDAAEGGAAAGAPHAEFVEGVVLLLYRCGRTTFGVLRGLGASCAVLRGCGTARQARPGQQYR
jgi:hypothetical protein